MIRHACIKYLVSPLTGGLDLGMRWVVLVLALHLGLVWYQAFVLKYCLPDLCLDAMACPQGPTFLKAMK